MTTSVADDLRGTLALLHQNGWKQYSCGSASARSSHDLVGALLVATGGEPYGDGNPRYSAAYRAVSSYLAEHGKTISLVRWNDEKDQTVQQICEVLTAVIEKEKKNP